MTKEAPLIHLDVTDTLSASTRTGIQRVVVSLARELFRRERAVLVRFDRWSGGFVPLDEADRVRLFFPVNGESRTMVRWPLVRYWKVPVMTLLSFWKRTFSRTSPQVDLSAGVYVTAEILGDPLRHRAVTANQNNSRVSTVFILHDLFPLTHPEWTSLAAEDFQRHWSAVSKASLVAAVSNHTKVEAERILASAARRPEVFALHPGHFLHSQEVVAPVGWKNEPYFLCVGTIEHRKNQVLLLEAFVEYRKRGGRHRLVFVGRPGKGSERFIAGLDGVEASNPAVSWHTEVPDDELQWLYQHAEATLYPSLAEGFGLPIVESLAAGTPCLTAVTTSTGELASLYGGCVSLDPLKAGLWADAMQEFEKPGHRAGLIRQIGVTKLPTWSEFCDVLTARIYALWKEAAR